MKIAIRTDSSFQIGTGHVVRCLTLARELEKIGHRCKFICRDLQGNLNLLIAKEFQLELLPKPKLPYFSKEISNIKHESWAEIDWQSDAFQTRSKLKEIDLIICDHYSFDWKWELIISKCGVKIMVIDDLADRKHICNLLLDATLGRNIEEYIKLTSKKTVLLVGVEFALIRPEFKQLRNLSISSRLRRDINNILISIGGMDENNFIPKILLNLAEEFKRNAFNVSILISGTAPNLLEIKETISKFNFNVNILEDKSNVGEIMKQTDIAISSCGLVFYELLTMTVPTILLPISDIQMKMAKKFIQLSPAIMLIDPLLDKDLDNLKNVFIKMISDIKLNKIPRVNSIAKFDGKGLTKVIQSIEYNIFK